MFKGMDKWPVNLRIVVDSSLVLALVGMVYQAGILTQKINQQQEQIQTLEQVIPQISSMSADIHQINDRLARQENRLDKK